MCKMSIFKSKGKIQKRVVLVAVLAVIFIALQFILNLSSHLYKDEEHNIRAFSYRSAKPVIKAFMGEKIVHLDLKGAAPSVSYFKEFFPYIKQIGATGLLIEYEDMFPYKDELENIKALNAYKASEIRKILELAESNGLSVIPLIQTFGHLEFVLKLKEYRDLREIDAYPHALCPSYSKSFSLLQKMIDQILEAHPKSKYLHVGCDEVYHMGECNRCTMRMKANNWGTSQLFIDHVKRVIQYIAKKYPKVRPIMWNDMLMQQMAKPIKRHKLGDIVDIMVWSYKMDVSKDVSDDLLRMYKTLFKSIWIASSYKGSTGVNEIVSDAKYHLTNHMSWMDVVNKWEKKINFKGIALTGWQRYDHFSVLCELLPVSIPSLSLALYYLNGAKGDAEKSIMNILQCDSPIAFDPSSLNQILIPNCRFPGYPIYEIISNFFVSIKKLKFPPSHSASGWMSAYHVTNRFVSPSQLDHHFSPILLNEARKSVREFEKKLTQVLSTVYDEHTVKEWMAVKVTVLRIWLDALYYSSKALRELKEWPRRPFLVNTNGVLQNSTKVVCSPKQIDACGLFLSMKYTDPI